MTLAPGTLALAADAVLALHVAVAAFVVGGLPLTLVGNRVGWAWVNRRGFRIAHAAAIGVVVAEAWFGVACPLTTLEQALRERAGVASYDGGLVEHALQRLLFYAAPAWVFVLAYSSFGVAVLATWWRYPPQPRRPVGGRTGARL